MQPKANIIALAQLHISAPKERFFTKSKPVATFPEAMIFTCLRIEKPFKASSTKANASRKGIPTELENSNGAAPVPPSPPSTVIKSGLIPVFTIALQIDKN